jgi:MFS family permease
MERHCHDFSRYPSCSQLLLFPCRNVVLLIVIRFIHGLGFGAAANAIMVIGMASLPKADTVKQPGISCCPLHCNCHSPFAGGLIYDNFGGAGAFWRLAYPHFFCVIFMSLADVKAIEPESGRISR